MQLEYDGTRYQGFQWQPDAPTIQSALELAIEKTTGEKVRVFGAGRTDSGVHARAQVAGFLTHSDLSAYTCSMLSTITWMTIFQCIGWPSRTWDSTPGMMPCPDAITTLF